MAEQCCVHGLPLQPGKLLCEQCHQSLGRMYGAKPAQVGYMLTRDQLKALLELAFQEGADGEHTQDETIAAILANVKPSFGGE